MATITKNRARKLAAAGSPSVDYWDANYPLLRSRKHISVTVGDHILRLELDDAEMVAKAILAIVQERAK